MKNKKIALVIGGTSGLGLELAKLLLLKEYDVFITGRKKPKLKNVNFINIDLCSKNLASKIGNLIDSLPKIDFLSYAAGFYQKGTITELSQKDLDDMFNVGLIAPIHFLKQILIKQKTLPIFVPISSTSQWTPRLKEPVYAAVKGGLGMLANSVSLDPKIKKTLLVAPAGMNTEFWDNTDMNTKTFLDPKWVATQIMLQLNDNFNYKFIKILRESPRVVLGEIRE
ncbi:MAG: SDR family NAD(P)-dependent oxidoreductase [Candidatus Aenigmarchaeota archaeon]|nr:SDR family NAD(P)-dependent oxidoreductase [Candidatus Aenigmarchaeota archaeon]